MACCSNCSSDRIMSVSGKTSDNCVVRYDGKEHVGYVPRGIMIGGGDYLTFGFCLECGQMQGEFPAKEPELE